MPARKPPRKPAKKITAASHPPAVSEPIDLSDDGPLVFRIKAAGQEDRVAQLDLLLAKITCERLEQSHKLQVLDGYFVPTAEFISALAAELSTLAGQPISPTLAVKIWPVVNARMADVKKNMSGQPN